MLLHANKLLYWCTAVRVLYCCTTCAAACNCVARAAVLNTLLKLLQSHVSELTRGLAATALAFHPDQPLLALVSWRVLARG